MATAIYKSATEAFANLTGSTQRQKQRYGDISGLDQVVAEHDELRALFRKYDSIHSRKEKVDIVNEVVRLTSQHASAEERTLYPLIRDKQGASEGAALYNRFTMDDQVNKTMLDFLGAHARSALHGTDEEWRVWDSTAHKFFTLEQEHLTQEEQEVVSRLRTLLTKSEKEAFTSAWRAAKATAPTKPHPNGPTRTPWTYLGHPLAAGVDMVTDTVGDVVAQAKGKIGAMMGGGGMGSGGVYGGAGSTRGAPEPHGLRVA